jgi:two-component system, chemotaxis family, chemotaxis protein CheY
MKILIIDDSTVIRLMLKSLLKQYNFTNIVEATNGLEGIEILKKTPMDLILLDLHMPELDGLEVLKMLKNDAHWKTIPVIIVTSDSEKETIDEGMKLGAASYITKPFRNDGLREAIAQAQRGKAG